MGKGEIARNEQFLHFQHCFQKTCTADTGKGLDAGKIPLPTYCRIQTPSF